MNYEKPDLSFLSDIELIRMQNDLRKFPEDKEMLTAVLEELGKRDKKQNKFV